MENSGRPKGWKEITLGEVAEIGSATRIFAKDYEEKGVPFYRSKEIIEKAFGNDITESIFISTEKYKEIKNKYGVPVEGDLLLSSVGNRSGIPYVVRKEKFYFKDGNLTWFKNFLKDCNSIFIYYWLKSNIGQASLNSIMIGSAQKALTISALQKLKITIPSTYEEQVAIGQVLSSLDEKIELLEEENKTLETLAQTIFTEWFVNFNFPGATGKMEDSELGEIPKGWRVGKLGEEFDISIGRTPPRKEQECFSEIPNGMKWVSIKDMGNSGVYIYDTSEYITDEAIEKYNVPIVPKNTVILSFKMTVGKLSITPEDMLTNEAIAHMKIKSSSYLTSEYIYLVLHSLDFNTLGSTSSIVTAVNSTIIKNISFLIPSKEIIEKFKCIMKSIFEKIKNNTEQVQALKTTRNTLLPKLITGEIRVEGFGE